MPLNLVEFFGYAPSDKTASAQKTRANLACPFVGGECIKKVGRGELVSGACSVIPTTGKPVIVCPNRMYAGNYAVLLDVAIACFGEGSRLCKSWANAKLDGFDIFVFGRKWGKELRVPNRGKTGGYSVDWVLAHVDSSKTLKDFVAVELQTMDTTGNYGRQVADLHGLDLSGYKKKSSNINWENVAKRILPQLIYKGHVLHQEPLCTKGLFFICPKPVYENISQRLGNALTVYKNPHPGSLTFRWYDLADTFVPGSPRDLLFKGQMTTTVAQVELAFTSSSNLPPPGVYEKAIRAKLGV